jgi:hypothetical protein
MLMFLSLEENADVLGQKHVLVEERMTAARANLAIGSDSRERPETTRPDGVVSNVAKGA